MEVRSASARRSRDTFSGRILVRQTVALLAVAAIGVGGAYYAAGAGSDLESAAQVARASADRATRSSELARSELRRAARDAGASDRRRIERRQRSLERTHADAAAAHAALAAAENNLASRRTIAVLAAVAALLAAIALAFFILRRTAGRLSVSLAQFVHAMRSAAGGRTDLRLDPRKMEGEFADAALAINRVAEALQEIQDKSRKQMKHLQNDARLDFLTGLPNRRYFTEELERDIAQTRRYRYGAALTLIMIDLDHFKSVNDTYGHETGDVVLKDFAALLAETLRRSDFCARMGGEEFAVICPETDIAGATKVAQKIRQSFGQLPLQGPEGPFFMTLSAGVAIHDMSTGATELIQAADALLYHAKEHGRNQVAVQQTIQGERAPSA